MVIQFEGPALNSPAPATTSPSVSDIFGGLVISQSMLIGIAVGALVLWGISAGKRARHAQKKRRVRRLESRFRKAQSRLESARRKVTARHHTSVSLRRKF